jgi:hypothetical protein
MSDVTSLPASKVKTEVLIAWLYEAANDGVEPKGMRRLCWLAAEKLKVLTPEVKTGELPNGQHEDRTG